jgi:hypothetical protein
MRSASLTLRPALSRAPAAALLLLGCGLLSACADTSDKAAEGSADTASDAGSDGSGGMGDGSEGASPRGATLHGQVSDRSAARTGLGGEGSVSAVTEVVATSESGELIGSAEVMADGSYALDVEPGASRVVLQGLDAAGEVVLQALVVATPAEGEEAEAPTMDTESSLEAQVWARIQAESDGSGSSHDMIDLMARIDARIAGAAEAAVSEAPDEEAREELASDIIIALTAGISAAQEAEARAWSELGSDVDQDAAFDASATLWLELSAAVESGAMSREEAEEAYLHAMLSAMVDLGLSLEDQAAAEQEASAAFRLAVDAMLEARGHSESEVEDAADAAAAESEAHTLAAAVMAHLEASSSYSDEERELVVDAMLELVARAEAAESEEEAEEAYADFAAAISAMVSVEGGSEESEDESLLDLVFGDAEDGGIAASLLVALDLALSGSEEAEEGLEIELQSAFEAMVESARSSESEATAEGSAMAEAVAEARDAWMSELMLSLDALLELASEDEEDAINLMVWTEGSFSVRSES